VLLAAGRAAGDAALQLRVADVAGDGWHASEIGVELLRDDAGRLSARLAVGRLDLPAPVGSLQDLQLRCGKLRLGAASMACENVTLAAVDPRLPALRFTGRLEYRPHSGALSGVLEARTPDGGRLRIAGASAAGDWEASIDASAWPAERLAAFAGEGFKLAGRLDASLVARTRHGELRGVVFSLESADLGLANPAGTIAAETLRLELRGSAWRDGGALAWDARGSVTAGEAYVEPVYADLDAHPLRYWARGKVEAGAAQVDAFGIEQRDVARADGSAQLATEETGRWRLVSGELRLLEATLPGAYRVLLQPLLAGTDLADLESSGRLRGALSLAAGKAESLWLDLEEVNLDDRSGRLAIYGLNGRLAWDSAQAMVARPPRARPIALHWAGGFVYGIPFGPARLRAEVRPGRWRLVEPATIPVLDGALSIETLELGDFMAGAETLRLDARLDPVSMRELSRALDWPPLAGRLSGTLPRLSYADGVLSIGGELRAEVFGGLVAIRELRVDQPLKPLARLQAEVELEDIDLEPLTEAFSFGLMTGRLAGRVSGLKMIGWQPVAFDARLHTPPGDRSRKRISQRAVDNIASLGGGGAGVLSTGFLRFFETFSYDAFALGCRLEQDVCEMSGLEPRDGGYLILRGSGLPRIDVLGFATRVSWSTLVEQLASIVESEGPELR
jgi:hypothetical protein